MRKYNPPPVPSSLWTNPLHFIAFGFGSGALPVAPGTFGTLIAIPFYLAVAPLSMTLYMAFLLLTITMSVLICDRVSKDTQTQDHQGMCLDEIIGFFVTMTGVPAQSTWIIAGFLLFRLFDIWKPWPINWIDKNIHGGFGMILDDILAGIAACALLHIIHYLI